MTDLASIPFQRMDGSAATLGDHAGEVVLIVNVASKCGLTPQYEALEALHREQQGRGFTVLGFPANDFGAQEPGTDEEIAEFCSSTYDVTFPVMRKISVVGDEQHPLFAALTAAIPTAAGKAEMRERFVGYGMTPSEDPDVLWNFEKFLVGRDGTVVARFAPATTPDDPAVRAAVEAALASQRTASAARPDWPTGGT